MRILCLLLTLALAGCLSDDPGDGNSDSTNTQTGGPTGTQTGTQDETPPRQVVMVTVTWSGIYGVNGAYNTDEVRVPANSTVELTFVNNEQNPVTGHDLDVEGIDGADGPVIDPGEEATITFDVGAPMQTEFFCSVGTHRQGGMEGTFIVE